MNNDLRTYLSPDQITIVHATIPASDWIRYPDGQYQQIISIADIDHQNARRVDIDMEKAYPDNAEQYLEAWSNIHCATAIEEGIKFTCYTGVPQINIPILVEVFG